MGRVCVGSVKTERLEMGYVRFGTGQKTFVILPGLSIKSVLASAEGIANAYSVFADEYTVYLFDRRSDLPNVYSVYDMAKDTAEAIDALGLSDVDLFGVSQGGMIAQCIAIERPELVRRLVLGSTLARCDASVSGDWIELAEKGDAKALFMSFAERVYSVPFMEKFGRILVAMSNDVTPEDLGRFIILARAIDGFDVYDRLAEIQCPTLVIGAQCDRVTPVERSVEIAEKLGCELYVYPEPYAHAVYDEAPDYKERILDFIKK